MSFHVEALDAAQEIFNGLTLSEPSEANAHCDALQAVLRVSNEFAAVSFTHDSIAKQITLTIDRAPESVEGFEGQSERLYVTYSMPLGEPLKYYGSQPE